VGVRTKGAWIAVLVAITVACAAKTTCAGDSVDCGGECVQPLADSLHCGACGNVCGFGTA